MARGEIHLQLVVNYADDPKLAALVRWPREARATRDLYVQMCCYAKAHLTDGHVPAESLGKLVFPDSLKVGQQQADMLVEVGVIEPADNGWVVCAFLKRNPSKAAVDAKSKARSEAGQRGGTRSGLVRNVEAKRNGLLREDEAKKSGGLNPEVIEHRTEVIEQTSLPRKRGTKIDPEWKPSPAEIEWQRGEGIGDALARRELPKFIDYWLGQPSSKGTKADWPATWRNWLRRAQENTPTAGPDSNAAARIQSRQQNPLASAL